MKSLMLTLLLIGCGEMKQDSDVPRQSFDGSTGIFVASQDKIPTCNPKINNELIYSELLGQYYICFGNDWHRAVIGTDSDGQKMISSIE